MWEEKEESMEIEEIEENQEVEMELERENNTENERIWGIWGVLIPTIKPVCANLKYLILD